MDTKVLQSGISQLKCHIIYSTLISAEQNYLYYMQTMMVVDVSKVQKA